MKRLLVVGSALLLLIGVSGCSSPQDKIMDDMVKAMNEMADVMEGLKPNDPQAAMAALGKFADIAKRVAENEKKLNDLKLSDADKKKLEEKYKPKLEAAKKRIEAAAQKSGVPIPGAGGGGGFPPPGGGGGGFPLPGGGGGGGFPLPGGGGGGLPGPPGGG